MSGKILDKLQRTVVFEEDPGLREGQITSFDELEAGMGLVLVSPGEKYEEYNPGTDEWDYLKDERPVGIDFYCEPVTVEAVKMRFTGGHSLGAMAMLPKYASLTHDENFIILTGPGEQMESGIDAYNTWSVLTLSKADLGMEPYMRGEEIRGWGVSYLRRTLPDEKERRRGRWSMAPNEILTAFPGMTRYL